MDGPVSLLSNRDKRTGRLVAAAPDGSVRRSSAHLGWRGLTAELHAIPPDHQAEHDVRTHRLMVQTGPPARFELRDGGAWRALTLRPGDVVLLPDGTPNEPRWHDALEFVAIGLDPSFVSDSFGDTLAGAALRLNPAIQRRDATLASMAAFLETELRDAIAGGPLFGETAALAIARHLLVGYGSGVKEPRGTLAGRQLARVVDHIDAHLAEDLGLHTLAHEAGLSTFHFARLFRATTGLSPHQFVIRRRADRARRLMRADPARGLAEVAVAAGFYDQAHLARAFRQLLGATPAAIRADLRNG